MRICEGTFMGRVTEMKADIRAPIHPPDPPTTPKGTSWAVPAFLIDRHAHFLICQKKIMVLMNHLLHTNV